uniref:Deoxyribonuclease TATDN3 n=1 Tax=Parascaris univalens TaxID=6257 RepID=A0A915AG07_PARUN
MIDCHCHLADEQFADDIDEVVDRARRAGVAATLVCSEFSEQFIDVINLSKGFPGFCFPCIGIHPIQKNSVSVLLEDVDSVPAFIEENIDSIAAIGEVGLDFSPRFIKLPDAKDVQVAVFRRQIELAITHNLTLNVHSRSACRPAIDVLRECGAKRVLMHAFDGSAKNAQAAIEAGYYFSIPPSFSFSERKVELVSRIPLAQLCLETDSPVLGPSKSERNEPANIGISAAFIAKVKGVPLEEVIRTTAENAIGLFPMLKCLETIV